MLTETLYSRILGTAREKGLVYSMSSGVSQTKNSTNWWFGAQVMMKNATPLFEIMRGELEAVFAGEVLEADIAAAKQYALGKFQRSGQTVGGTANGYSTRYFFDGNIDDYYKIPQRIEAINKDIVIKTSKAMFKDQVWGLGMLGSANDKDIQALHELLKPLW